MAIKKQEVRRCWVIRDDPQMEAYHDEEWGVPLHDDRRLFEFLVLDAFQAGLSWAIVLHKREAFRRAFAGFNPRKVARFGASDVARLVQDERIIRNRQKILATIENAKRFLEVQRELGSFDRYIWQFTGHRTIDNRCRRLGDLQAKSPESDAMSADLRARGFKFVGSTICYAFMQAAGMVNDHLVGCPRHREVMRER
jgi:DNA-3-methyladenine glycosylase I